MFARYLAMPFVLAAMVSLYLTWEVHRSYSFYMIPSVVMLAIVFVLSPQLNWWWYSRHPQDLSAGMRALLEKAPGFYQRLDEAGKLRFRQRIGLFRLGNEFMPQGMAAVPVDAELVVGASAVTMLFHKTDLVFSRHEHVILYNHHFPSPQFPEIFHLSEVFDEDGVVMFSMPHLFKGFLEPGHYFPLGLYEYARIYMRTYPEEKFPELNDSDWPVLERISGFSREGVQSWINTPDISLTGIGIAYYFSYPDKFKQEWPEIYNVLVEIFAMPAVGTSQRATAPC